MSWSGRGEGSCASAICLGLIYPPLPHPTLVAPISQIKLVLTDRKISKISSSVFIIVEIAIFELKPSPTAFLWIYFLPIIVVNGTIYSIAKGTIRLEHKSPH